MESYLSANENSEYCRIYTDEHTIIDILSYAILPSFSLSLSLVKREYKPKRCVFLFLPDKELFSITCLMHSRILLERQLGYAAAHDGFTVDGADLCARNGDVLAEQFAGEGTLLDLPDATVLEGQLIDVGHIEGLALNAANGAIDEYDFIHRYIESVDVLDVRVFDMQLQLLNEIILL